MERVVGILNGYQCRRISEPFDEWHQMLHGRERIARSLQEEHGDMHLSKVLRAIS